MNTNERFWSKVDKKGPGGCWLWTAGGPDTGYGSFYVNAERPKALAHRYAYELLVGPIPKGLELDHLCRVRRCVNPAHLEPVTRAENLRRSPLTFSGIYLAAAHCVNGHEWNETNTRIRKDNGTRACRKCHQIRKKKYRTKTSVGKSGTDTSSR